MKVYRKLVIDIQSGKTLEEDSFDYHGPVSLCGGGPSQQSSTTRTEPPKYLAPYLENIASEANRIYGTNPTTNTVAGFSPETEQALQMQANRARSGSDLNRAAQDQAMSTIRGDYMNSPEFMSQFQAAANKVTPQVSSMFARSGRTGGGLAQAAQTEALGNAYASLVGQERQNQLDTMRAAPQMAMSDYADMQQLANVGAARESYEQDVLNARSDAPWGNLNRFAGIIGSLNGGGTQTTSQPLYRNRLAGAAGGALAGAQLGSFLPGIGTAAGAGLGGLLGLF